MVTSYLRSQPTRILYPTETFRLQSASIRNVSMNGDFRYTKANMNLPNYYDSYQGLNGTTRSLTYTAVASARREVVAADYGIVWQAMKTFSLSDQVDFSDVHQPGTTTMTSVTTLSTPATAGNETINYAGPLNTVVAAPGASTIKVVAQSAPHCRITSGRSSWSTISPAPGMPARARRSHLPIATART